VSGSSTKRAAARQRIEAKRAAESAARAHAERRRRLLLGAVAAGVVALVVLVVILVQVNRTSTPSDAATPAGTVADGTAIPVGPEGAPVVVDLYEDFLCPACRQFETINGETLTSLAEDGSIRLQYRPIAFLDRASTDEYSTRALNAAGVVLDAAGTDAFREFHDLLFAEQPAEGGPGLTDDRLIELAAEAGASGADVEAGIRDRVFEGWADRVTERASQAGVNSTPTLLIDGEPVDLAEATPENITALVEASAEG
jgi:protein-disulfide isomerase